LDGLNATPCTEQYAYLGTDLIQMIKHILIIAGLFILTGCVSSKVDDNSIAGGGCDRQTTYSVKLDIPVFPVGFDLAAKCESTPEAE